MSTIAVFGGTGKTGSEVVFQALNSGFKVIVLARDPNRMLIPKGSGGSDADKILNDPKLTLIQGSVTDPDAVDKLFASDRDISGVVVALGGKTKDVGKT
jgi:nucleoside-diphosphate-sugar epimerase